MPLSSCPSFFCIFPVISRSLLTYSLCLVALLTKHNTQTNNKRTQLRKVNLACFPVQYQESYYKDVVERKNEGLCKFAYYNGFVVGAACARIENIPNGDNNKGGGGGNDNNTTPPKQRLYIMTLGVLAAYRGRSIGAQLIQTILDYYEENKDTDLLKDVIEICLHVQISNDDAIKFYIEKFNFIQGDMVENYYRRIDPPHCYLLYKKLK